MDTSEAGDAGQRSTEASQHFSPPRLPAIRQRDPPTFSGMELEDVDDWLDNFERVSRHNGWDATTKINIIIFYLSGVAKTWFLNHEADLRNWATFTSRFRDLFGRSVQRTAEAHQKLAYRVQQQDESYTSYIEDVLALCNRADPQMTEEERIRHVTKGIREDAFQIFVVKSPTTVAGIVEICRVLQNARSSRIRLPSPSPSMQTCGASLPATLSVDSIRSIIREVVREELGRSQLPFPGQPHPDSNSDLQSFIRREVVAAMSTTPTAQPSCFETVPLEVSPGDRQCYGSAASVAGVFNRPPAHVIYPPRNTLRETAVCYYCGIPGHISRFCRKRQRESRFYAQPYRSYASPSTRDQFYHPSQRSSYRPIFRNEFHSTDNDNSNRETLRPSRRRSPSPYPRLSPSRSSPTRFISPARPENR